MSGRVVWDLVWVELTGSLRQALAILTSRVLGDRVSQHLRGIRRLERLLSS